MAVIEAIQKEANTLHELWLGNVPPEFQIIIFAINYYLAAGAVKVAISQQPLEQSLQKLHSMVGLEVDPVGQAKMHLLQHRLTSLLAEDPRGFSVIDNVAYSEQGKSERLNKPYGQLVHRIVGIGTERYKKLYCEVTGMPYTPKAK